ncbi:MAG: DUF3311 domain-containing protein [Betaproteobacteria bacterium]|nr:DUF3311 domain-containing protein [Betaproteobacteria bacterium]
MSDRAPARKLGPLAVLLLAIPCVAVLAVPWFNTDQPELFGMPFFYWWQLLWVPLSSLFIGIVYKMVVSSGSGD